MLGSFFKGLGGFSRRPEVGESAFDELAILLHGRGTYALELTGASRRQADLYAVMAGKGAEARRYACVALLTRDEDAPSGLPNVAVHVDGVLVGYFPRYLSSLYGEWLDCWKLGRARVHCRAIIQIERPHAAPATGECRVKLDVEMPFKMTTIVA